MNTTAREQDAGGASLVRVVAPLDAMRAGVLRALGRPGRTLLVDRGLRVAVYAAVGLLVALLLAFTSPVAAFFVGPLVLGVPHLVADVRYLVVQPGLHRRKALVVAVGVPLVLATVFPSPALGLAAGLGAIAFARATLLRRVGLAFAWSVVVLLAARHATVASLVVVHGHNALAVVLFLFAFARSRRVGVGVLVAGACVTMAILSGAADSAFAADARLGPLLDMVAPRAVVADPVLAMRLGVLFVFAQSFHYALWLRVIPDEARERPGLRSFESSLRALDRDLGRGLLVIAAMFAVVVLAKALTADVEAARVLYLRGATFHAYLEVAFALLLLAGERR